MNSSNKLDRGSSLATCALCAICLLLMTPVQAQESNPLSNFFQGVRKAVEDTSKTIVDAAGGAIQIAPKVTDVSGAYGTCQQFLGDKAFSVKPIDPGLPITADRCEVLWPTASAPWHQPAATRGSFGHSDAVSALSRSHDGKFVASGDIQSTLVLWDVGKRKPIFALRLAEEPRAIVSIAIAPDNKTAAVQMEIAGRLGFHFSNRLVLVDLHARRVTGEFAVAGEPAGLVFSGDSQFLVAVSKTYPGYAYWSIDRSGPGRVVDGVELRANASVSRSSINPLSLRRGTVLRSSVLSTDVAIVGYANEGATQHDIYFLPMDSSGKFLERRRQSVKVASEMFVDANRLNYVPVVAAGARLLVCSEPRYCFVSSLDGNSYAPWGSDVWLKLGSASYTQGLSILAAPEGHLVAIARRSQSESERFPVLIADAASGRVIDRINVDEAGFFDYRGSPQAFLPNRLFVTADGSTIKFFALAK